MNLKIIKTLGWIALSILFLLIATSGIDSYFLSGDESGYFLNLELIDKYGISTSFLQHFSGMAGPLHPILHWLLRPLTGAVPPAARFVNFVILCVFVWHFRRDIGERLLFIPMTFVCAGYAMTEFPAMLFLLYSILIINSLKKERSSQILQIILSGFCLSLAIAGRWNYLVLLPLFWIWFFIKLNGEKLKFSNLLSFSSVQIFLFLLCSLIFPIWILSAWKGLAPPEAQLVEGYGTFDIAPHHLILSGCFSALMMLILRPQWLMEMKKSISLFTYFSITVFVTNLFLNYYNFLPAKSLFNQLESYLPLQIIGGFFGSLSICMSLVFLYNLFLHAWKRKNDWTYVFYSICTLAILLTSIKTTHIFSSRYPYQAIPFLLLMLQKEEKTLIKWWEIVLAIGGIGGGIAIWFSYQTIYG